MDMRALVGDNVKRIRQARGLTQEQFAERSGFSQQYLSTLERGRRNPSIVTIYELASALGVSHLELVRPRRRKARKSIKPNSTARELSPAGTAAAELPKPCDTRRRRSVWRIRGLRFSPFPCPQAFAIVREPGGATRASFVVPSPQQKKALARWNGNRAHRVCIRSVPLVALESALAKKGISCLLLGLCIGGIFATFTHIPIRHHHLPRHHLIAGLVLRARSGTSTLRAVAAVESHFEPWAVRDNTTHEDRTPSSLTAAVALAEDRLRKGHSVDLGLMQINSGNLASLGMGVKDAFDPCRSLDAANRILRTAFAAGSSEADRQAAILITLSRYNTGRPLAGIANGYANRVIAAQSTPRLAIWHAGCIERSTTMGHLGHLWCRTDVVGRHGGRII